MLYRFPPYSDAFKVRLRSIRTMEPVETTKNVVGKASQAFPYVRVIAFLAILAILTALVVNQ